MSNQLTFNDVCNLNVGDTLYENMYGGSIKIKVISTPEVFGTDTGYTQVRYKAEDEDGKVIDYLSTKGLMHYGPDLTWEKEYFTQSEIQEFLKKNGDHDE